MSSVMNPRGPLPPHVYWIRRAIVLVALVLVIVLIMWLGSLVFGGGDSPSATKATQTSTSAPRSPGGSDQPRRPRTPTGRPTQQATPPKAQTSPSQPTDQADPTVACDPTNVDMTIQVDDATVGDKVPATFTLSPLSGPDCLLSLTPDVLEVQVTTGDTTVWSSTDCPDALPARKLAVRSDPATTYRFTWNGKISDDGCQQSKNDIGTGGYFVQAAFIGGEPHEAYFDMR